MTNKLGFSNGYISNYIDSIEVYYQIILRRKSAWEIFRVIDYSKSIVFRVVVNLKNMQEYLEQASHALK